jgi:hypothetical protein
VQGREAWDGQGARDRARGTPAHRGRPGNRREPQALAYDQRGGPGCGAYEAATGESPFPEVGMAMMTGWPGDRHTRRGNPEVLVHRDLLPS